VKLSPAEERIHEQSGAPHAWSEGDLVQLDPDHPGFRDAHYRERRNAIARIALQFQGGAVPRVEYTAAEDETWRAVQDSLAPLHDRYACAEYREGASLIRLRTDGVPQLADVNQTLERTGGFTMRPVAGLVGDRTFLGYLFHRTFLATQYMRHPSRPLYTPEPDVVHELIGHAPTFCEPSFAALNRAFGEAAERVDAENLAKVARLYWYTLEFGVCKEHSALKAYGAGLLSSSGELGGFEERAALKPFDPAAISATPYDPTDYQRVLFVADSFSEMAARATEWLASLTTSR
jgi:phenylalanine-4-hydroxylase